MKKLKIAYITSANRGLAHYVVSLDQSLRKYFKTYYITYADALIDDLVKEKFKNIYKLIKSNNPQGIIDTLNFLKKNNIKYININIGTTARKNYLLFSILLAQAKLSGIKIIGTLHDVMPFESFYIEPAAIGLLYLNIDYYLVGSESEKDKLQTYFDVPSEKIYIVKHGPYLIFDNKKYTKFSAREKLNIAQDKKTILFFGSLKPHKGLKYLVKAFGKIKNDFPKALLYISTDLTYSPQLKEYVSRIKKSGAAEHIKLITKFCKSSEIEPIFKASDIVVLPYTNVSQSGILQLAYGFKKPVIVTNIFSDASLIHNKFGVVVKNSDVDSLANGISKLLRMDNKKLIKLGEDSYSYAIKYNSWDKIAETIYQISKNDEQKK